MNSISKSIGTASLCDDTQSFAFDALSFDPEEFGFVSLLDTQPSDQEKFSLEDVPQLEEECTSNVSPFKRDRCPDNWEAVQSVAKRRFVEPPIGRCGCKKSKCIMVCDYVDSPPSQKEGISLTLHINLPCCFHSFTATAFCTGYNASMIAHANSVLTQRVAILLVALPPMQEL